MNRPIDNQHVIEIKALPSPRAIKTKLPITDQAAALVVETREAIRKILHGKDRDRLLVIVGPCSIHDPEAAFEYASKLKPIADALRDRFLIVMRTYFEKPRTTVGWKGLINDPRLDGTCDIAAGMELARAILLRINQLGLPCGTELLDPISPQYVADLISWAAIGARTTESQTHREMASGVSMPVGFKNGTEGSLQVAINAMTSARTPHHFVGVNADGRREVLGMTIGASEAETFWTEFLRSLTRRGLRGVKLVISDAHEGLKAAIALYKRIIREYPKYREIAGIYYFLGHALNEKIPRIFHQIDDLLGDGAIVHGVGDVIGTGRRPRLDVESQIDQNILPVGALIVVDANDRAEKQVVDEDLIGHGEGFLIAAFLAAECAEGAE